MQTIQATRKSNFVALLALLEALLGGARSAVAHPGHDLTDASVSHLLTSPDHLVALATMGGLLWAIGRLAQRRSVRPVLQFSGAACLLAAAIVWGLHS